MSKIDNFEYSGNLQWRDRLNNEAKIIYPYTSIESS